MRRVNRKRPIDFILPFLVILGLGVIGILGFQIWQNFVKQGKADVYFYIAEGKAKVLPYGNTEWDNAFSGTKLLIGDSLKTAKSGKAILQFFNGSIIRLAEDTAVTLTDITKSSDLEKIVVNMDNGMIWVHGRKSPGVRDASYEIRTTNMVVKAKGTVFEVESKTAQTVRVLEGEVKVDVLVTASGNSRVADTITVGVGQEITLDDATLKAFAENKTPSVLMAISDQFKAGDWYSWNIEQDRNPLSYAKGGAELNAQGQIAVMNETQSSGDAQSQGTQSEAKMVEKIGDQTQVGSGSMPLGELGLVGAPEILKPGMTERTVSGGIVTISGVASMGTAKIVVEQLINGEYDSYTLSKFKPGDKTWSYNVAEKYGNLAEGANTYSFYAYDEKGNKSAPSQITITYDKKKVSINDVLTAPKALKFNGADSSKVTTGEVLVEGSVRGAQSVVVNGYKLSKFEPGSATWLYWAKESLGNLRPGVNVFEVYAVDAAGNKSDTVKFTITYDKAVTATATPSVGANVSTQQSSNLQSTVSQQSGATTTTSREEPSAAGSEVPPYSF